MADSGSSSLPVSGVLGTLGRDEMEDMSGDQRWEWYDFGSVWGGIRKDQATSLLAVRSCPLGACCSVKTGNPLSSRQALVFANLACISPSLSFNLNVSRE